MRDDILVRHKSKACTDMSEDLLLLVRENFPDVSRNKNTISLAPSSRTSLLTRCRPSSIGCSISKMRRPPPST
eukprot:10305194-Prorocentrum_lima.AAC.1